MTDDPMIAALLREREGYVRRGLTERVAQVDEQLVERGCEPLADDDPPAPTAPVEQPNGPRGRRAARKATA